MSCLHPLTRRRLGRERLFFRHFSKFFLGFLPFWSRKVFHVRVDHEPVCTLMVKQHHYLINRRNKKVWIKGKHNPIIDSSKKTKLWTVEDWRGTTAKKNGNKELHDKIDSSYEFILHRRQYFLFRRETYDYTCKSPYTEKLVERIALPSESFLYKDEVFPSPLIQICLQFKGMLNVDWTSTFWFFETSNSILLL